LYSLVANGKPHRAMMSEISQELTAAIASNPVPAPIEVSLVLATLSRTDELANFLVYLDGQSYRNFELIVVDQNDDGRLLPILAPYQTRIPIKHVRSAPGLSRARNVGLTHASGDVITFPDDDCWYDPDTLQTAINLLQQHPEWDGVTGAYNWPEGHLFDRRSGFLDRSNVWGRAISSTIFVRESVVKKVGKFDERLGVGSDSGFWSGEETDYLLRALENQCRICYQHQLLVNHPPVSLVNDANLAQRGYRYGRGLGYTLRKHRYPVWYVGYVLLRAGSGMVVSLAKFDIARAKYYGAVLRGRISGWLG